MKFTCIQLFLLSLICFSCGKSNGPSNPNPPDNTPKDSLFAWRAVGSLKAQGGANDIWFTSPAKGFTAVADGNLYLSSDSGKTWTKIPNTTANANAGGMLNLFFVGATYGFAQSFSHLEVTKDGGQTWSLQSLASSFAYNIYFTTPGIGYYGDINAGLYKTTDTGKTWTRTLQPARQGIDYPVSFLTPDKGFVLSGDAIFSKTTDSGSSWQQVQQNIFVTGNAQPTFNGLQFIDEQTGFYASHAGLLKTTDGGLTWKNTNNSGGNVNVVKFFNATLGYFKTDNAIYKTTDGGQSWTTSCKFVSGDVIISMYWLDSSIGWATTGTGLILRIDHQ